MEEDEDYQSELSDLNCELCEDTGLIRISKFTFGHRGPSLGSENSCNECEVFCTCRTGRRKQRSEQELQALFVEPVTTKKPLTKLQERIRNANAS